jgi:uncharacterized protein
MRIQVGSLSNGIHTYHFQAASDDLGLPENFSRQVKVDVTLDKQGSQMFLRAMVSTEASFLCDRCLSEFSGPLAQEYHMYYLSDPEEADRFDEAEVQLLSPALNAIDIGEDVRQTLLLGVPLKLLCSESCRGLCPTCGVNRNLASCDCEERLPDPRWDALRKLNNDSSKH